MRKHNKKFATRWTRKDGDRSNFPQSTAHGFVNSKFAQFASNSLLQSMLLRAGCLQPAPEFAAPAMVERGPAPAHIVGTIAHIDPAGSSSLVAHLRSALRKFF